MKIALAQMISANQLDANLKKMHAFVIEAKSKGAELIVFPEMAYFSGTPEECSLVVELYPKLIQQFSDWAKTSQIAIMPGSVREPNALTGKPFNTLPYLSDRGAVKAVYRKIFLFKAALSDRSYDETRLYSAGNEIVTVTEPWGNLGTAICFDLRFSELFRALKKRGAKIIVLPSAFTVPTGKAHWHTLLKARAIENQCFVLAPGQVGRSGDGSQKFGHSLVVAPWGEVLLDLENSEGVGVVDIDLSDIEACTRRVDPWASRREDLFPIG